MPHVRECSLGYAINTGSVGNSLGVPRVHALVIHGELGSEELSPLGFEILSIPYDNEEAAKVAGCYTSLPNLEGYQNEVLTGNYSR